MNQENEHPSAETLIGFIEEPDNKEFVKTQIHLVSCDSCRRDSSVLQAALMKLMWHPTAEETAPNSLPADVIADYVDDRLTVEGRAKVNERLASDPISMKAALHYAKHSELMRIALPGISSDAKEGTAFAIEPIENSQPKESIYTRLKKQWDTRWPLWLGVSVMVTAAIILAVLIPRLYVNANEEGYVVANYQDNPTMVFTALEEDSGLGFFNSAQQIEQPFEGFRPKIDKDGSLRIHWQKVEGASEYSLRIYLITETTRKQLVDVVVEDTYIVISDFSLKTDRRYEWELTGKTGNNQRFRSMGGFVVTKPDS
jgi:hypothetical protein